MIAYDEALQRIAALRPIARIESVGLAQAARRVLAEDLVASIPSPAFTNSAMDGFAGKAADFNGGKPLAVLGAMYAGASQGQRVPEYRPGSCVRIMTGAPLPLWADSIVQVERTMEPTPGTMAPTGLVEPGANIRRVGEDIAAGALLLKAGTFLDPERLMMAANFGYGQLKVRKRPRVLIVSTGDELTEPGSPLAPGAIFNSSRTFLEASVGSLNLPVEKILTLRDDLETAVATIQSCLSGEDPTLVVTTGAVSAGDLDFVPELAARLGFETLFHGVGIRPGKPVYAGIKGSYIWLGLPGNPISTAVTWQFLGRPILAAWAGIPGPLRSKVTLKETIKKPAGLRCFYRAVVQDGVAWVSTRQGSAHFLASADANTYIELSEHSHTVEAATTVDALTIQ